MPAEPRATRRASGRPRGSDSTRAEILRVARAAFAAGGYEGTSLRTIARQAHVDPSTAVHFFGTKAGLFEAVIEDLTTAAVPFIEAMGRGAPGVELASTYLSLWEDPADGPAMLALARTAISSDEAMGMLRSRLLGLIAASAGDCDPTGAALAVTLLLGVVIGRHIARHPNLVDLDVATLAQRIGPVLDHYLAAGGAAGAEAR